MNFRLVIATVLTMYAFATKKYLSSLQGIQEFSITCDNEEELTLVLQTEKHKDFDFMKIARLPYINVQVLVKVNQITYFKQLLDTHGIKYDVTIKDFSKVVEAEYMAQNEIVMKEIQLKDEMYSFNYFPRYQTINKYLRRMSQKYKDITLFNIGSSYEKRKMYGVKISSGGSKRKPAILIDAGIHAREWIAPVTALFAISELSKKSNRSFYKNIDWYIIPLLNPDGYEFSHTKYRLWRKTRSKNRNSSCRGVDANRNFDFMWMGVGASNNSCHEIYAGSRAFSEVETRNLRDFILSHNCTIKIYLTLHSFGKYLLHPWGYTRNLPNNECNLRKTGKEAIDALAILHGTQYTLGSSSVVLYPAAGGSDDWAMSDGGADLSYTIELPGSSFVINSSEIKPVGLETFEAFKVFAKKAESFHEYD